MTFQPGKSGNPLGRNLEKIAADSLRIVALEKITEKGKHKGKLKLRRINEKIVDEAIKGEPWACQMVHDRLDGKPLQSVEGTMTHQAGDLFIEMLRALNQRRGQVIEHDTTERPATNGSMAAVGD